MHLQHDSSDIVNQVLERGFDRAQAQRLVFVRWSVHEGYAQFSEYITSDAPVIDTR
jgi:hypothetical protein